MRHQLPCDACARGGKVMVSMYRCPRCMRTSCSLVCVKSHKSHYSCDGVRDRAAKVSKRDYTEAHFMSDYTLLEDARRAVDAADAVRPRNYRDHRAPRQKVYPDAIPRRRMELLAREAAKRGTDLRFMPSMFLRHRRNSSDVRSVVLEEGGGEDRPFDRVMIWCMEVVFWGRGGGTRVVKISDVDEDTPMKDVLVGAIGSLKIKKDRLTGKEDPYIDFLDVAAEKIGAFLKNETGLIKRLADAPIQLPDVYLKKAKRRRMADGVHVETYDMEYDTRKFNAIETGSSVRESLYGRSIVEYPIVHVAVKGSQEEKQIVNQLKDLFEKPEPAASEDSASEDERYEPEDGEVREGEGGDTPMPDASQEGSKVEVASKEPESSNRDPVKTGTERGDGSKMDKSRERQSKETDKHSLKEESDTQERADLQKPSAPHPQTVGMAEASTSGPTVVKATSNNGNSDVGTAQERETTPNVSSPSLQDIEPLPRGHFDDIQYKDTKPVRRVSSGRSSRGGKKPIVRADDSGSEYDDEDSLDNSDSEAESEKEEAPTPEEQSMQAERRSRVGKRKSRFSDLQTGTLDSEGTAEEEGDDMPSAKRQKQVTIDSDVDDDEDGEELAVGKPKKTGGKVAPPKEDANSTKSPPLPFAFEYDSALLSDRIPRRKKLASSGSLQTLKSC